MSRAKSHNPTQAAGMLRLWRASIGGLTAVAIVLLPGCGGLGGLDATRLEREIAAGLTSRDVVIEAVECPEGITPRAGDVFSCRVHSPDGSAGVVTVTQQDSDGTILWELTSVTPPSAEPQSNNE